MSCEPTYSKMLSGEIPQATCDQWLPWKACCPGRSSHEPYSAQALGWRIVPHVPGFCQATFSEGDAASVDRALRRACWVNSTIGGVRERKPIARMTRVKFRLTTGRLPK